MTREQAIACEHGDGIHENGCKRTVGPCGGVTVKIEHYRVSGKCQTWKRKPDRFRLPIKYGLYGNGEITEFNAQHFHLASECPLRDE